MEAASAQAAAKQEPKAGAGGAEEDLSMEEILHSIRKIIAEDDGDAKKANGKAAPEAVDPTSAAGSDVLELTEMLKDDGSVVSLKADANAQPADVLNTIDQALGAEKAPEKKVEPPVEKLKEKPPEPVVVAAAPEPVPVTPPVAAPAPVEVTPAPAAVPTPKPVASAPVEADADSLLAPGTTATATEKLKKLQAVDPGLPPLQTTPSPTFASGETVEGMVMTMLKPMMKQWLDANLPQIVERIVEREVRKLTKYLTDKGE